MNVEQTALIRQVDREAFARDGAVVIRQLLDPQWLDLLAEVAEEIRHAVKTGEGDGGPRPSVEMDQKGDYVYCENGWMFNDKLRRFAEASDVACAAAEVMGSKEARLFETLSIYKEQGCDVPTAWHQDLPQHGIEGDQVCSVWLSLEAVDEPSGALRFVPGSHLGPWFTPGTMPPGREGDRVPLPAALARIRIWIGHDIPRLSATILSPATSSWYTRIFSTVRWGTHRARVDDHSAYVFSAMTSAVRRLAGSGTRG